MTHPNKRYERGYGLIKRYSTDKKVIKDYFNSKFRQRWNPKRKVKILDIGCADGEITKHLLQNIGPPSNKIQLSLIEPSREHLIKALKLLHDFSPAYFGMSYNQYLSHTKNVLKYDLIFSGHCIYHTGLKSLGSMLKSLSINGTLFIIVSEGDQPFMKEKRLFPWVNNISGTMVFESLKRLGCKKLVRESEEKCLKVHYCLDKNGNLTEEGKNLSSTLLVANYEQLNSEQHKAIRSFFKKHRASGEIKYYNDFIWASP